MKVGPPLAMAAVLGLSVWIVLGMQSPTAPATDGATRFEMIMDRRKIQCEQIPLAENGGFEYRFLNLPAVGDKRLSATEFQQALADRSTARDRGPVLRALNVSGYAQLAWVGVGLLGQLLFSGRMVLQWVASEKKSSSVVPPAFWYLSLGGGLLLAAYFIWRMDLVGVLGQSSGIVIYARNIRLLNK
ncbi:MAG: lipid-A-disaccharide synthase N-terminal domain-containing protein, partial [Phycisphaerales bacterium]